MIAHFFFFSSRRRHTRSLRDWSSDVCSSDLGAALDVFENEPAVHPGLTGRDDVVLLPHLGSATLETRQRMRSEERRVGKECRCRWWRNDLKKKKIGITLSHKSLRDVCLMNVG